MIVISKIAPKQYINPNSGLAMIPSGAAFVYLFRRYGYPNYYSNKTVAGYSIKTSIDDLWINFDIKGETCYIQASPTDELFMAYERERLSPSELTKRTHEAVVDCLIDQFRPVLVDGCPINILGETQFKWNEKTESFVGEVAYFELDPAT